LKPLRIKQVPLPNKRLAFIVAVADWNKEASMTALYLGTRTRTFIATLPPKRTSQFSEKRNYHIIITLLPKISSLVSEKRKTASFAQMLFYAILATKSIVKVHVHPDDSGRH
jgi:hypothetical protein